MKTSGILDVYLHMNYVNYVYYELLWSLWKRSSPIQQENNSYVPSLHLLCFEWLYHVRGVTSVACEMLNVVLVNCS